MASTARSTTVTPRPVAGKAQIVRPGRLPVSEFAFDRAGAASPFGDDLQLPLPVASLTYVHPREDAFPAPH
jgi:succinate dehydrogenase / fumarate reductase iron-sulfur subunit